jgi:hypothetical protein
LPTFAGVGYLVGLLSPRSPHGLGLSLPAVVLYFMLGSGVLRLPFGSHVPKAVVARPEKGSRHWV